MKSKVYIIIPFLNESGNILKQLKSILKILKKEKNFFFKIILVDDASDDGGYDLVKNFMKKNKLNNLHLVKNKFNMGKTGSLKVGIKQIKSKNLDDFIIFMDGDFQDNPNDIPKFLRMTNKKYDLVIGKQEKNYNIFIKMSSKIYKFILRTTLNMNLNTPSPQFLLVKIRFIKNFNFIKNYHRYIAIHSIFNGAKHIEIEVKYLKRKYGKSKFSKFKIFSAFFEIIHFIYMLRTKRT